MFKKIVITSRLDREDAVSLAEKIVQFIREKGLKPILEAQLASKLGEKGVPLDKVDGDLVVVVGGDGTVLWVVHKINGRIPLYAVKVGKVGFFADTIPTKVFTSLEKIFSGKFFYDECLMLKTNLDMPEALNEVRIGTIVPQQMMEISVFVDEVKIAEDRVDAVVVATPVGASAYALSAGANIVDPRVEAFLIAPICPLSSNFKPYIVPSNVKISIKPESKMEYLVLIDGQIQKIFKQPLNIQIWKSEKKTVFLRTEKNFYERLKRRLKTSCVDF